MRADGIRVRRGPLAVVMLDDGTDGSTRVAYSIPKQVGSAVIRNRLKRRMRAIVSDLAGGHPELVPSGALLFSCRAELVDRTPNELRKDVVRLLTELNVRRSPGLEPG